MDEFEEFKSIVDATDKAYKEIVLELSRKISIKENYADYPSRDDEIAHLRMAELYVEKMYKATMDACDIALVVLKSKPGIVEKIFVESENRRKLDTSTPEGREAAQRRDDAEIQRLMMERLLRQGKEYEKTGRRSTFSGPAWAQQMLQDGG